jgi:hypothetical protein
VTLTQITLFFGAILLGLVCAMFIHSWLDKRGIVRNLRELIPELDGALLQPHPFVYPRFHGSVGGRDVDLFFTVVKVGRKFILYIVYRLASSPRVDLLLIRSGVYKPMLPTDAAPGTNGPEGNRPEVMGPLLPDLDPRYEIHARQPEVARPFFEKADLGRHLTALSEFTTLQLGPDALVIGKPYDGLSDTAPENVIPNLRALSALADAMETAP